MVLKEPQVANLFRTRTQHQSYRHPMDAEQINIDLHQALAKQAYCPFIDLYQRQASPTA